jgi:hypothetical protein
VKFLDINVGSDSSAMFAAMFYKTILTFASNKKEVLIQVNIFSEVYYQKKNNG